MQITDFVLLRKLKVKEINKKTSCAQLIMLRAGWKPREPKEARFVIVTAYSAHSTLTSYCLFHTHKAKSCSLMHGEPLKAEQ